MRHEWPWGLRDGLSFESPGFNSQGWIIKKKKNYKPKTLYNNFENASKAKSEAK
jgi:hypothetical protein